MHLVCLILEYFPLKPGSLKILPPPPTKKSKLKCRQNLFAFQLNNIEQERGGGGVTIVANSQGGSPLFVQDCKHRESLSRSFASGLLFTFVITIT